MNCSPTERMVEKFKRQKDPVEQDGQGTPTQRRRNVFIIKRSKRQHTRCTVRGRIKCEGVDREKQKQKQNETQKVLCFRNPKANS